MLVSRSSPFGGRTRTEVLLALSFLRESYPRELARVLQAPLYGVQRALGGLETAGLVASRLMGRMRVYRLNPRYFALGELEAYLQKLSEAEPELRERTADLRRRPRRPGKPL